MRKSCFLKQLPFLVVILVLLLPSVTVANSTRLSQADNIEVPSDVAFGEAESSVQPIPAESETNSQVEKVSSEDSLPAFLDQGSTNGTGKASSEDSLPVSTNQGSSNEGDKISSEESIPVSLDQGSSKIWGPITLPLRMIKNIILPTNFSQRLPMENNVVSEIPTATESANQAAISGRNQQSFLGRLTKTLSSFFVNLFRSFI